MNIKDLNDIKRTIIKKIQQERDEQALNLANNILLIFGTDPNSHGGGPLQTGYTLREIHDRIYQEIHDKINCFYFNIEDIEIETLIEFNHHKFLPKKDLELACELLKILTKPYKYFDLGG